MSKVHAFILSGGSGTRLWPLSTGERPKQFHSFSNTGRSLFEESVKRARRVAGDNVWIVTGRPFVRIVKEVAPDIPETMILVEPFPRNTAGAIAWALVSASVEDDDIIVVMPSDHYIEPENIFAEQILKLARFCGSKFIGLTGIVPDGSSPFFGYIVPGKELEEGIFEVSFFKEKPDERVARNLIKKGALWNSGIFVMSAGLAKRALSQYSKPHADFLREAKRGENILSLFGRLPSIQFDRAVLEKAENMVVMKAAFSWFDLGTWDAVVKSGHIPGTEHSVYLSCSDSSVAVSLDGRPIAVIGVEDVIVVSGEEGVLVVKKGKSAEVKKVVNFLEKSRGGGP